MSITRNGGGAAGPSRRCPAESERLSAAPRYPLYTTSVAGHATITAATKLRIRKLTRTLDRKLQADRDFFARRADRSYRVRRSFREEELIAQCTGRRPLPDHLRLYIVVRQIQPGSRARAFFFGPPGIETDLTDAAAKVMFDNTVANDKLGDVSAGAFIDELAARMASDTGGQP